jgi:hypothetical protein
MNNNRKVNEVCKVTKQLGFLNKEEVSMLITRLQGQSFF